jgi:hypothetical protein
MRLHQDLMTKESTNDTKSKEIVEASLNPLVAAATNEQPKVRKYFGLAARDFFQIDAGGSRVAGSRGVLDAPDLPGLAAPHPCQQGSGGLLRGE